MDSVLTDILARLELIIQANGRDHGSLSQIKTIVDNPSPQRQLLGYLVSRLNQLPFSRSTSDYNVLEDIFSGIARYNISRFNEARLFTNKRMPTNVYTAVKDVVFQYADHFTPLVVIRYGTKDLERLLQKVSQIVLGERKEGDYINDFYRFRMVVMPSNDDKECYRMSDVASDAKRGYAGVESIEVTKPDYIMNPKDTGYRSLHHVVHFKDGRKASLQIRDHPMDLNAERDPAQAHNGLTDEIERAVGELPQHYVRLLELVLARK